MSFAFRDATAAEADAFVGAALFGIGASWGGYESGAQPARAAREHRQWQGNAPVVRRIGLEDRATSAGRPGAGLREGDCNRIRARIRAHGTVPRCAGAHLLLILPLHFSRFLEPSPVLLALPARPSSMTRVRVAVDVGGTFTDIVCCAATQAHREVLARAGRTRASRVRRRSATGRQPATDVDLLINTA